MIENYLCFNKFGHKNKFFKILLSTTWPPSLSKPMSIFFRRFIGFVGSSTLRDVIPPVLRQRLREYKEPFHQLEPGDKFLIKYMSMAALNFPVFVIMAGHELPKEPYAASLISGAAAMIWPVAMPCLIASQCLKYQK